MDINEYDLDLYMTNGWLSPEEYNFIYTIYITEGHTKSKEDTQRYKEIIAKIQLEINKLYQDIGLPEPKSKSKSKLKKRKGNYIPLTVGLKGKNGVRASGDIDKYVFKSKEVI